MNNRLTGKEGENDALTFLRGKNYRILASNYRAPCGEIDIIAADESGVVFVEVKTRTSVDFGFPEEAVDIKKIKRMEKTALFYLRDKNTDLPFRFEIVSIIKKADKKIIRIVPVEY